ncbi:MAG: ArnT family glycosyltransferase, partial [Brevefilum sp.]
MMKNEVTVQNPHPRKTWTNLLLVLALLLTVVAGAYLRLVGVNWDEDQHMHPDERFLSLVQVAISPVDSLGEYFDTESSSLNPANRGYGFFVYGTLPIFIVRYAGEALGQTDYHAITLLGRQLSAVFDVATVLLVFGIGKRLYNRWVGLLGAAFYALAVLPIQLSHFATVDTITNTFAVMAMYAGVWALTRPAPENKAGTEPESLET